MRLNIDLTEAEAATLLGYVRTALLQKYGLKAQEGEMTLADINILVCVGHIYTEAYLNQHYAIKTKENIAEAISLLDKKLKS